MGIKGLNNIIKRYSPDSITINPISSYKGSKIAVDCSILIYKFRYFSNIDNSHIIGFINRIKYYIGNDILPVFIFDGLPIEEKQSTIQKRKNQKHRLYEKIEKLRDIVPEDNNHLNSINLEIEKISSQIIKIKKEHIDDIKLLLNYCGIPWFLAPNDAEKFCAFLQINNLVDYTVSDDSDALTFGCERVLKTNISKGITELNLAKMLGDFNMSYDTFVDFCILSGCDYCESISKIGPITSYNLLSKHKNLEETFSKHLFKEDVNDYIKIRNIFKNFDYEMPLESEIVLKKSDKIELMNFLKNRSIKEINYKKLIKFLI